MREHNQRLSKFINNAQLTILEAKTSQDLLDLIDEARSFNGNFQYNNRDILIYLGIDLIIMLFSYLMLQLFNHGFWGITLIITVIALIPIIGLYFSRRKSISGLADDIFWKDLYIDNNLSFSDDYRYEISALKNRYQDFRRGNYSQSIEQLLSSFYLHEEESFNFHYYHFHYVDERIVEKTDSDGKKTIEKKYDHYDRYGVILPYEVVKNVSIIHNPKMVGHNTSDYEPSSLNFRKLFKVKTQDTFQASKLLTPSIVEFFESLPQEFKDIVIEFKENEFLLSFTDQDVISAKREYDFNNLDLFFQEIQKINELPKLLKLHNICNYFIRSTQNSFD